MFKEKINYDLRNIIQWTAFVITIGSCILSAALISLSYSYEIYMRVFVGGLIAGGVILLFSYLFPKVNRSKNNT